MSTTSFSSSLANFLHATTSALMCKPGRDGAYGMEDMWENKDCQVGTLFVLNGEQARRLR